MGLLHSPTPIHRYVMSRASSVRLRLKPLAAPSAVSGALESGLSSINSGRRFSSPRDSSVHHLRPVQLEQRFSITLSCGRSSITSESVEVFQALGAPRSQRLQPFLFSGLLLTPNPTCTHLHGSNASSSL
jgi:hypothetical protein